MVCGCKHFQGRSNDNGIRLPVSPDNEKGLM